MGRRTLVIAAAVAALSAGAGLLWERARFGAAGEAAGARVAQQVRTRLADSAARLRATAERVAADAALIHRATTQPDARAALFGELDRARLPTSPLHAITVYAPDGTGGFRLLAWSEGPGEDLDPRSTPTNRPSVTVVPGAIGLRLIATVPALVDGRAIGIVAAERILATGHRSSPSPRYAFPTALGSVEISPPAGTPLPAAVVVHDDGGQALVEVSFDPAVISRARAEFRGRVWAVALLPIWSLLALWVWTPGARGRGPASVMLGVSAWGITRLASLPDSAGHLALAAAGLAAMMAWPVSAWWRGLPRRSFGQAPIRASLELLASGLGLALLLAGLGVAIDRQLESSGIDWLASPLFPFDGRLLLLHLVRLCLALAVIWGGVAAHAALLDRWRLRWPDARALWAVALGTAPAALLGGAGLWWPPAAIVAPIAPVVALAVSLAALGAAPLRRRYRRASQSTRLLWTFGAVVLPALVIDPIVSLSAERATENAIEGVHAAATLGHPAHLLTQLQAATTEIDALADLQTLVEQGAGLGSVTTDAAFRVWSRTALSRGRLTSAVELYGPDGTLTSRFALNVPEYGLDRSTADRRCDWDVYGEVDRTEELRMLHAERGVCDAVGRVTGAVVLHVIFDYRALPYLSTRSPYDEPSVDSGHLALADRLQVAVYGWSRLPLFTSGPSAWPLDGSLLERLERSRDPFWITRQTEAGRARVYFLNDRAGIYALGYPVPSTFEHLSRLAETTALAGLVFLVWLTTSTLVMTVAPQVRAPLRAVVAEVRTSFYRKLFLFFVLTALLPVAVLALAFSAYMGEQLRSDVETEAAGAVTTARRILEDAIALQQVALSDDVMVWIARIINQDVNVYDGARVRATSQRDLFDSGRLPERTPARAYRAVSLDRVPTFVEESETGPVASLVAAAPVPRLGREAVLLVPLTPRQREIEREISDLNRGILLGAIGIVLLSAGLGAWVAQRVADPVARLTRATQQIASGRLDVRIVADTADELRRLVTDFNSMAATLREQRAELGRTHELKAWADMSRQVAHDVKNPLTPIQLAAEHLQRVHDDRGRPLGPVFDQCVTTILQQVRLLRQIASEFSTFAASPTPTLVDVPVRALLEDVVRPYRPGLTERTRLEVEAADALPDARADRTLLARALTNLVENALQAMPSGGTARLSATSDEGQIVIRIQDTGLGMSADALARAFEPHFSTKTGGSGLGLANARRNVEACGGTITAESAPGRGTTMTVRVPAVPQAEGGTRDGRHREAASSTNPDAT